MKKGRCILILITLSFFYVCARGQRVIGSLESNTDQSMVPSMAGDSTKSDREPPIDVKAWTIDDTYGNIRPTAVDTMMHQFQNKALPEGVNGHYNNLTNVGSPRINRIFMERQDGDDFMFANPFDFFHKKADEFLFYNTKSPYVNLTYNVCGSKTTGFDDITAIYTQNAGKRINIGGKFNYLYGSGYYDNLAVANMKGAGWFSYLGDHYNIHLQYTHDYIKRGENGGIQDETYITNPESFSRSFTSNDIPTWMSNTWMRQELNMLHLSHRYNIGIYKEEGEDSASMKEVFIPVTSIFHTLHLQSSKRRYTSYKDPTSYYQDQFLPGDSTNDVTSSIYLKNIMGLSLREGFNKWAAAGVNAYIGIENKTYELPDSPLVGNIPRTTTYKENNVSIGGQIIRTQGTLIHFDINGELTLTGENSGDFYVKGKGELNIPFKFLSKEADTMHIEANAYIKNLTPNFYHRHFHARNIWWDNNLDKENRTRIEGIFSLPHTKTKVTVGVENIKNMVYLQNYGNKNTSTSVIAYKQGVKVLQSGDNIQVLSVNLRQDFAWKILHFDNDITFQTTSDDAVLPLPTLSTYHNLYIKGQLVKGVLTAELGGDLKYFTKYYAPDYAPAVSQFINQNPDNRREFGGYPLISVYAAFDLKQLRAYIQYYHVNQSSGNYFWAAGYPMDPATLRFGLSWNFYD